VQDARVAGLHQRPEPDLQAYWQRDQDLVQVRFAANLPPPGSPGSEGPSKQGDVLHCLLRFPQHEDSVWPCMTNVAVPIPNNQAETDLPMMKVQQKISGCLRTRAGIAVFCELRSSLSPPCRSNAFIFSQPYVLPSVVTRSSLLSRRLSSYTFSQVNSLSIGSYRYYMIYL
jgi:transposase